MRDGDASRVDAVRLRDSEKPLADLGERAGTFRNRNGARFQKRAGRGGGGGDDGGLARAGRVGDEGGDELAGTRAFGPLFVRVRVCGSAEEHTSQPLRVRDRAQARRGLLERARGLRRERAGSELGPEPASAGGGAAPPPPASAAARAAGSSGSTSLSACTHAPSARPAFSFAASKFPSTSRAMSASTVAVTARDDSRRSSAPRGRLASGASLRGGISASGSGKAFFFGTLERPSANARAATSRVTADANASARGAPRAPSAYDAARAASASISPFPSRSISAILRSSKGNVPKPRSVPSASARRRDRGFEAAEAATRSEQNVLSESV